MESVLRFETSSDKIYSSKSDPLFDENRCNRRSRLHTIFMEEHKMSKKNTKRALLSSVLALVLCFAMLTGTTFAWFTDSVTSGKNQIVAGNLDVELVHTNAAGTTEDVQGNTNLFLDKEGKPIKWEPGVMAWEKFTVQNVGNLALKYQLSINFTNEVKVDGHGLSEVLKVAVLNVEPTRENIESATLMDMADFLLSENNALAAGGEESFYVAIYWKPTDHDNDYNMNNGNQGKTLSIDLGVKLMATQQTAENDSFGNDYDSGADYIEPWDGTTATPEKDANGVYQVGTAAELAGFAAIVNGGDRNAKISLNADINLGGEEFTPIGGSPAGVSGWNNWFNGTFDGNGHTIYGLKSTEAPFGGLVGLSYGGTIKNVNIDTAHVIGGSYASGIVGYGYCNVENCKVSNSTLIASYASSFVSYRGGSVKNCTATNNAVVGWYCDGGIIGLSGGEPGEISGNKVVNCNVFLVDYAPTTTYRGAGDIVGCITNPEMATGNTASNNNVVIYPYAETTVIANAADLLAEAGTNMAGTFLLVDDIDMEGAELKTIGVTSSLKVIGNGYTISNFKLATGKQNGMNNFGLFYVETNASLEVSDLTVKNAQVEDGIDEYSIGAAVLVGYANGGSTVTLNNVDVVDCSVNNTKGNAALYVGYSVSTVTMNNCDVSGSTASGEVENGAVRADKTGAFIGTANTASCTVNINNCANNTGLTVYGRVINGASLLVDGVAQ